MNQVPTINVFNGFEDTLSAPSPVPIYWTAVFVASAHRIHTALSSACCAMGITTTTAQRLKTDWKWSNNASTQASNYLLPFSEGQSKSKQYLLQ